MANVQLKGGMNPLYHCQCKRTVVATADGVCWHCERGIKQKPPTLDGPTTVDWKKIYARRDQ